jgi:GH15 family glucan-1,4-alpha-glucosidase
VRDQANVAAALAMLGAVELSRTMIDRLLAEFVTDAGDTVDSSERRGPADVELDQNGTLLHALDTYVSWSGDLDAVRRHWPRVRALAEFPLQPVFRHPECGLLHNQREYWERHGGHGIRDGMELMTQFYVSVGLSSAARLARLIGRDAEAQRWQQEAQRLRQTLLNDQRFGLVEQGRFVKRRNMNGSVQADIVPPADTDLPPGIPLLGDGPHYLNPDASTALPIALGFVDPRGDLARATLAQIEQLWNQRWSGGGYGRYHVTSEPDSPGPWPFPSVFVARAYLEAGADEQVWRVLDWLASVPGGRAGTWFEFYGPRPVPPYPQVGIVPWTWAELVCLFLYHVLGVRPEYDALVLRPRLLSRLERVEARLRLRGHDVKLTVRRGKADEDVGFLVDGARHPHTENGLRVPLPQRNLHVEAVVKP